MTAARELIAEETVLREAEKIPAIKNPARPEKIRFFLLIVSLFKWWVNVPFAGSCGNR